MREWKKIALQGLPEPFERNGRTIDQAKAHKQQVNDLYSEIGQLTTQVNCAQRSPEKNLACEPVPALSDEQFWRNNLLATASA